MSVDKQAPGDAEFQYEAFISYRHVYPDDRIAKALQSRIENYRIPSGIAKLTGRAKTDKVFRDRDELPTSADLGSDITAALERSRWLIVICSPNTPLSKWCMKEIDTFIALGRRDRILALLVDGEPGQSFPPQLLFADDGKGALAEVEPLAADIRGKTIGGMRRKLKTESLRLLSPILGVGFDDLKRRSRERAIRRALAVSATAAALLAAFSIYAVSQALIISRQSEEIFQSNTALKAQIGETQLSQSKFLTSLARKEYGRGNELAAVQVALAGLPVDYDNPERPIYNDAIALLRQIELRNDYNVYKPVFTIDSSKDYLDMAISPDGRYIAVADMFGYLRFYSAADGLPVENSDENTCKAGTQILFSPDNTKVYSNKGDMAGFDGGKTSAIRDLGSDTYFSDLALSGDGRVLAYLGPKDDGDVSGRILRIMDPETLEVCASSETIDGEALSLSYDGSLVAIEASGSPAKVYKTADLSKVFTVDLASKDAYSSAMALSPDGGYIAVRQEIEHYDAGTGVTTKSGETDVYNIKTGVKVLSAASGYSGFFIGSLAFSPNSAYFVYRMPDNTVAIYDTRTWQPIRSLQNNNNQVSFHFSPDSSLMVTIGSDAGNAKGNLTIWDTAGFTTIDMESGAPINTVAISSDNNTIAVGSDDGIKILRKSTNPLVTPMDYAGVTISQTGDTVAGWSADGSCAVYDRDTMQRILPDYIKVDPESVRWGLMDLALSPDRRRAIVNETYRFSLWDLTGGRKVLERDAPAGGGVADGGTAPIRMTVIGYSKDGRTIYAGSKNDKASYLMALDAETGETLRSIQYENSERIFMEPFRDSFFLQTNKGIKMYDTHTFEPILEIPHDFKNSWTDVVWNVVLSPLGDVILVFQSRVVGSSVLAYDAKSGGLLYQLDSADGFNGIPFLSDGKSFAYMDGNRLKQMDLYSGKAIKALAEPRETDLMYSCDELIMSLDKKLIACGKTGEGNVEVWNIETGNIVAYISTPVSNSIGCQSSAMFVNHDTALLVKNEIVGIATGERYAGVYRLQDDKTVFETAQKNLVRELTKDERKRYFID